MSLVGKIQSLFLDREKTQPIFPITKVKAVSDDNGKGLNVLLDDKASKDFVTAKIAEAQLGGGGGEIDLSGFATKDDLNAVNNKIPTTPEQIGAHPDTWLPTIAQIGAAPAGYGLGGDSTKQITTLADLDLYTANGTYQFVASGATLYGINCRWAIVRNTNYDSAAVMQELFPTGSTTRLVRVRNANVWGEWEVDNPSMALGVEYRTTERSNGSPVYCRSVYIEALAANSTQLDLSSYGISGQTLVRYDGKMWDSRAANIFWLPSKEAGVTYENKAFYLKGNGIDITGYYVALNLYYVK